MISTVLYKLGFAISKIGENNNFSLFAVFFVISLNILIILDFDSQSPRILHFIILLSNFVLSAVLLSGLFIKNKKYFFNLLLLILLLILSFIYYASIFGLLSNIYNSYEIKNIIAILLTSFTVIIYVRRSLCFGYKIDSLNDEDKFVFILLFYAVTSLASSVSNYLNFGNFAYLFFSSFVLPALAILSLTHSTFVREQHRKTLGIILAIIVATLLLNQQIGSNFAPRYMNGTMQSFFVAIALIVFALLIRTRFLNIFLSLISLMMVANISMSVYALDSGTVNEAESDVSFSLDYNVYYIQPDSYMNENYLHKYYENKDFRDFLASNDFQSLKGIYSNYNNTVQSNYSSLEMTYIDASNPPNYYKIIGGINKVNKTFMNNGYDTYYYAINTFATHNHCFYTFCNSPELKGPDLLFGLMVDNQELLTALNNDELNQAIKTTLPDDGRKKFVFVENAHSPGHIKSRRGSGSAEQQIQWYIEDLKLANKWLKDLIQFIVERDPNAMIVIAADHGPFVEFDYSRQLVEQFNATGDLTNAETAFSSAVFIRLPEDHPQTEPLKGHKMQSLVNLFPVVFELLGSAPQPYKEEKFFLGLQLDEIRLKNRTAFD